LVDLTWKTWVPRTPIYIWEKKLILVKQALKQWAKSFYTLPDKEGKYLKENLYALQKENEHKKVTTQLQKEELNLQIKYQRDMRQEEELWRIQSQSLWFKASDKNTIFFHNQAKARL
jgi:hypothetical protein